MAAKKRNEHSEPAPEKEQTQPETAAETEAPGQDETAPEKETAAPAPAAAEKPQEDSERYLRLMEEFDDY